MSAQLTAESQGGVLVYKLTGKKKKKKTSKVLRPLERLVRRTMMAGETFNSNFLDRHNRSRKKKKDEWIRKLDRNVFRAARKGSKKIKPWKIVKI